MGRHVGSLATVPSTVLSGQEPAKPRWYLARTNNGQERLARYSLIAEKFEVWLPLVARKNRKGELAAATMFPGYVFVRLTTGLQGWTKVFSARGVASVVGMRGTPTPVPERIVDRLKAREFDGFVRLGMAEGDTPAARFQPGQAVKVLERTAKVDPIDAVFVEQLDKNRAAVLIRLLGDERIATVALAHIE